MATVAPDKEMLLDVRNPRTGGVDFRLPVSDAREIAAKAARPRNNQRGAKLSEHAFGNALDVMAFILADGRQIPLRTETVFREGDSPGSESSRKIGGAAIGGAVLGAVAGHAAAGMSRKDLKELGEELDEGQAGPGGGGVCDV